MCRVEQELRREKLTVITVDVVERREFLSRCSGCELLLIFKLTEIRLFKHVL
jgi:hypothetical protein